MSTIRFNVPNTVGREADYLKEVLEQGHLSGDGPFTKKCHAWLSSNIGGRALLTHSCTGALEMACLLANLEPGDEVILPSYTFVSTANAVALRGAVPVFVDIREDTLNIDESLIEAAISDKTKAIIAVHYAGVVAEMDAINKIAERHDLFVIEDAAQALFSTYHGRQAGTLSHAAAFSFHETKNYICGEGGAICINDPQLVERAEIIRDKGTNRQKFFRGEVDKYTWVEVGSSFVPSEINCAFLYGQLEQSQTINERRREVYDTYHHHLESLETDGLLRRPQVPDDCRMNNHMYYILVADRNTRDGLIDYLGENGIHAVFHYVPLHMSPIGQQLGYSEGQFPKTEQLSSRLLRLPFFYELNRDDQMHVVKHVDAFLRRTSKPQVMSQSAD